MFALSTTGWSKYAKVMNVALLLAPCTCDEQNGFCIKGLPDVAGGALFCIRLSDSHSSWCVGTYSYQEEAYHANERSPRKGIPPRGGQRLAALGKHVNLRQLRMIVISRALQNSLLVEEVT